MGLSRYVNAIKNLDDVLVELVWRLHEEHVSTSEPSWELPASVSGLVIEWPTAYNWGPTVLWMRHLLTALRQVVRVERTAIAQEPGAEGIVVTRFSYQGKVHRVVIDFSDYMDRICEPVLGEATCYFKMQFRRDGYGDARIIPGGYPVASPYSYRFLSRLRRNAEREPKLYNIYGRFGLTFAAEVRQKAMDLLSECPTLAMWGGRGMSGTAGICGTWHGRRSGSTSPGTATSVSA